MPSTADQLARVQVETRAALAILLEPACEPGSAAVHLEAAWRQLVAHVDDVPDDVATEAGDLTALSRAQLVRHARRIAALSTERDVATRGPERRAELVRRWGGRAAAIAGVVVVLAGLWIVTRGEARPVRWRGAYFAKPDFTGQPVPHDDTVLAFDWGEDPPIRGIGRDGFSIRWDSCLVLDSARTVGWQLVSNDGSRLYVDGQLVVDNWEHKGDKPGGLDQSLSAGVHALRVEYRELRGQARITLLASLDGAAPRPIGPSWLRYPTGDDTAPCRGAKP